jgi:hypothetical protein
MKLGERVTYMRSEAEQLFPGKAQLYEIIYESRFCRF